MNASFTLTLFMKWTHPSHSIAFCRVKKLPSVGKVFTQNVWMDRRKDVVRRGDAALERVGLYTYQTSKLKHPVGDRTHDHSIARSLRGNFRRDENSTRYLISAPGLFFGWTVKHLIDANFNELWFPYFLDFRWHQNNMSHMQFSAHKLSLLTPGFTSHKQPRVLPQIWGWE